MVAARDQAWVGIDVGKTHHWVCAVDADGKSLLSAKIANDEAEILSLISTVAGLAQQLVWAVDIIGAPSAAAVVSTGSKMRRRQPAGRDRRPWG